MKSLRIGSDDAAFAISETEHTALLQVHATLRVLDEALSVVPARAAAMISGERLGNMLWLLTDRLEEVLENRGVVDLAVPADRTQSRQISGRADDAGPDGTGRHTPAPDGDDEGEIPAGIDPEAIGDAVIRASDRYISSFGHAGGPMTWATAKAAMRHGVLAGVRLALEVRSRS